MIWTIVNRKDLPLILPILAWILSPAPPPPPLLSTSLFLYPKTDISPFYLRFSLSHHSPNTWLVICVEFSIRLIKQLFFYFSLFEKIHLRHFCLYKERERNVNIYNRNKGFHSLNKTMDVELLWYWNFEKPTKIVSFPTVRIIELDCGPYILTTLVYVV